MRIRRCLSPSIVAGAALLCFVPDAPVHADALDEPPPAAPFEILAHSVDPGTARQLSLAASESFAGAAVDIPVWVIHGRRSGATTCLTGGVHGDEVNGVEVVRRIVAGTDPERLRGTILAIPIVNLHGFRRGSRYLPDRRDLNRYFPGRSRGSAASRIARAVFDQVVRRCDQLLDFHTGSFQRTNLPHARGDLGHPAVRQLASGLAGWLVLDHPGTPGTLRRAATDAGIPTLTFEVGGPYRLEPGPIERGVDGVRAVLAHLALAGSPGVGTPHVVRRSRWVRVDSGGLLVTHVKLDETVLAGSLLGEVVDPISNERTGIRAPVEGRVLGMAWPQVVIPGFAVFHLAVDAAPPDGVDRSSHEPELLSDGNHLDVDERPE